MGSGIPAAVGGSLIVATALDTRQRLSQVQALMTGDGLDLLLVTPSADLRYLTGYARHASERPTILAVRPEGDPLMLVPALEAPGATETGVRLVRYGETDNPFAALSSALGSIDASQIAISDQAWARTLLGLQAALDATFVPASPLLRRLRMVKGPDELDRLERAGRAVDAATARIVEMPFAGRTERQIADEINRLIREQGVEVAEWGPIVASGPNSASAHHLTGTREIREGDAVILDFGCSLEGYQADTTRTVSVGPPSDELRRVYAAVQEAQQAGVDAARPGVPAQAVDRAARAVIERAGYGEYFVHRTGHGLGLEAHEDPYIVEGNELVLEPGMVFSVEPGIYLPERFGVRIEDIVALTERGAKRLNNASRELTVVR
ncbi:MAG: aminopeptidase P family protein [Chloroflexi bacterium]|nr:aminopeptidase P family protein [Chloroflexota bacterium]